MIRAEDPPPVRLFGLLVVRDVADLLAVNLRHHLAQGVERFLVLDHGSQDATPAILEELAADGLVEWERVEGLFKKHRWINELAATAYLEGADWVLPIDADELWISRVGRLVDVLARTEAAALEVEVLNFVQQGDQLESTPEGLLRMIYRVAEPEPCEALSLHRAKKGALPFVALASPPKRVSRARPGLTIGLGNHEVEGLEGPGVASREIVCLHAPLRSRQALQRRHEAAEHLDPALSAGTSWQAKRWRSLSARELDVEWARNSATGERLGSKGRVDLVLDHRWRDAVAPWVEERARPMVVGVAGRLDERATPPAAITGPRISLSRVRRWLAARSRAGEGGEWTAERRQLLRSIEASRAYRLWMASIRFRRRLASWRPRSTIRSTGDPLTGLESRGFAGPVPAFEPQRCREILERLRADPPRAGDWAKDLAVSSAFVYELAAAPALLDLVSPYLGGDVMLWGASLVVQPSGAAHPWHTDIETASPTARAVSVWIGLENTERRSALALVAGSHRFGESLQEVARRHGLRRGEVGRRRLAAWSRVRDRTSRIVRPAVSDGEAILFDGRLWHGSDNTTRTARTALLLQYATPETPIRIPDPENLEWPFRYRQDVLPACLLLAGSCPAEAANRFVAPPAGASPKLRRDRLAAEQRSIELPPSDASPVGWSPRHLFGGATANVERMSCHVSTLGPAESPHPPHAHEEEELLIVLAGEPQLVLVDEVGRRREQRAGPGWFSYYPAGCPHTIRTVAGAATYLMFKWRGEAAREGGGLGPALYDLRDWLGEDGEPRGGGFASRFVCEGPTSYLDRLHIHASTVAPRGGYAPHADDHDVALVLLRGTIEPFDRPVEAPAVVFVPGGRPHAMRNPGRRAARYLVFELHGRAGSRLRESAGAENPSSGSLLRRSTMGVPPSAPPRRS